MSILLNYADAYVIPHDEAKEWAMDYINRPGEFPALIKAGLIEDTPAKRKASIMAYCKWMYEQSSTYRVRESLKEEMKEAA